MVLSVGALTWEKDPFNHLDVGSRVLAAVPDAIHIFVGDGPMGEAMRRRVAQNGSQARTMFLGSRADMGDVLAAADVVLFASRSDGMEGMPAVVIEGGMGGLPVAAFAVAGVSEVVVDGQTGLLAPPGNTELLPSIWNVSLWTPICEPDSERLRRHAVEPCSRSTRSHLSTSTYLRKWQAKRASLSTRTTTDLSKSTRLQRIHKDGWWFIA